MQWTPFTDRIAQSGKSKTYKRLTTWGGWALCVLCAPIWIPALLIAGVLWGTQYAKRFLFGPRTEWAPWFAWRPKTLTLDRWTGERKTYWLETIERRANGWSCDPQYRAPTHG